MAVLGIPSGPIGLIEPLRFKWLDSQPDSLNMGPVPIDVHEICDFSEKSSWLPDTVFIVFSARALPKPIFEVCGRNQKDARRKVMQIRGDITSRSAFLNLFLPI